LALRIAVDIGGTFTDLVALEELTGEISLSKTSTTPKDLILAVNDCVGKAKVQLKDVDFFIHGTTVAINAILSQQGAKTGLITTKGFRDVYEIGRHNRPEMYNLFFKKPTPLVPRDLRLEVTERIDYQGRVLSPLDESEVRHVTRKLREASVQSIAVCLLHSYMNPANEIRVGQIIREVYPEAYVSLSHQIMREYREYERASTTVLNSYVMPIAEKYLSKLEEEIKSIGFSGRLLIMQSNGGTMTSEVARTKPVHLIESGPAAGAIGAAYLGQEIGFENVISFDMGGTTAKTCLIERGLPKVTTEYRIGGYARGHPIKVPVIDLIEVGAGGGSIAWIDSANALKVGPRSAGAEPGPICYDKGGTEPTVTDANLVVGRINPNYFLGGEIPLNVQKAQDAIKRKIGDVFGMSALQASSGILKVADTIMSYAIRAITVERGYDPRDFTMIAFGGAGPMHAVSLARELKIPNVIVPLVPAHFSAWGMLLSDLRHDYVQTYVTPLESSEIDEINNLYSNMRKEAVEVLKREGIPKDRITLIKSVDMRYLGQEHTINTPAPSGVLRVSDKQTIRERFDGLHEMRYGHCAKKEPTEIVNLRLTAIGTVTKPKFKRIRRGKKKPTARSYRGRRRVYFEKEGGYVNCDVYLREALLAGNVVHGPAIIEEYASTLVLYQNDVAEVSKLGHLLVKVGGR